MDRPNTEDPRIGANTRTSVAVSFRILEATEQRWFVRTGDGQFASRRRSPHAIVCGIGR